MLHNNNTLTISEALLYLQMAHGSPRPSIPVHEDESKEGTTPNRLSFILVSPGPLVTGFMADLTMRVDGTQYAVSKLASLEPGISKPTANPVIKKCIMSLVINIKMLPCLGKLS